MKKIVLLSIVLVFVLTGCGTIGIATKKPTEQPEPSAQVSQDGDYQEYTIRVGKARKIDTIVREMLNGGEILDKQITAGRMNNGVEYSFEYWIIQDAGGDQHLVTIENGVFEKITPYEGESKMPIPATSTAARYRH